MIYWILDNLIGIIGIIVGSIIAYHVYFLSKTLDLKDKLSHKDNVRKIVEPILQKINNGISSKCELINIEKYLTHYPNLKSEDKNGYTNFGGELKALRFDGVEFFCGVKELYKTKDGKFTLHKDGNTKQESNVFEVGVIPYEWIEYVDPGGDEFSYRPQFFAKFKGLHKTPYRYLTYYVESTTYHKGSDPMDMKWRSLEINRD